MTKAAAHGGIKCPATVQTKKCNAQACPVDCVETHWLKWSTCTKTCGGGSQSRRRHVVVAPQHGGKSCANTVQQRKCSKQACPVDCALSAWKTWSACSRTCRGGRQARSRSVITAAKYGGVACSALKASRACNAARRCPIDCRMSKWTSWSTCAQSCANDPHNKVSHHRTRNVLSKPKYGGAKCGSVRASRYCNTHSCPVDCVLAEKWGAWSKCTKTCGAGQSIRRRQIVTVPVFGGKKCGALTQSKVCNPERCKGCTHTYCQLERHPYLPDPWFWRENPSVTPKQQYPRGFSIRVKHDKREANGERHHCKVNIHTKKCECVCYGVNDPEFAKYEQQPALKKL